MRKTRRKIAGQGTNEDFSFAYAEDRTEAKHLALDGRAIGTKVYIVIADGDSTGPAATPSAKMLASAYTLTYITGEIASRSKSKPLDGVKTVTIGIAMDGEPKDIDKT